jgi:hypothetical protein
MCLIETDALSGSRGGVMRYKDTGNVHMDFHLSTNATIEYILQHYDLDFLRELFRRTAQKVYKDLYENLKAGNAAPLVEHTAYYIEREGGALTVTEKDDEIIIDVIRCPAVFHARERGYRAPTDFCLQTALMNNAWSEGTPFEITTCIRSEGTCRQILRRKNNATQ